MIDRFPDNEEYYQSADELLSEDDIVETDVRILGWNKKFRIRALTFGQMTRINHHATAKKEDKELGIEVGDFLNDQWTYHTIVEGVIRPRFKIEQAKRLADSNGEFVKTLCEEIWTLGRINKRVWNDYIEEIKRSNKVADGKTEELAEEKPAAQ